MLHNLLFTISYREISLLLVGIDILWPGLISGFHCMKQL